MQEIIRKKRMEKNLSQKDLAEYLGVTSSAVSKWEKGKALPDVTLLGPLARLLKVSLEELLSFQRELSPEMEKGYLEELHRKLKEEPYMEAVHWAREILLTSYVPEQCNDEKLKKVLKVNDFRHFFLDFIIVTYYN